LLALVAVPASPASAAFDPFTLPGHPGVNGEGLVRTATPDFGYLLLSSTRKLTADDDDDHESLYRVGGSSPVLLASYGGAPSPIAISRDGSRVLFRTLARLTAGDDNDQFDLYLKEIGGGLRMLSGRISGSSPRNYDILIGDVSPDLSRIVFRTRDQLSEEDTDDFYDAYEAGPAGTRFLGPQREGASVQSAYLGGDARTYLQVDDETVLVRPGSPNVSLGDRTFVREASDGATVLLRRLNGDFIEADGRTGISTTLLRRDADGSEELVSSGSMTEKPEYLGASPDLSQVTFQTKESLSPADRDSERDIYARGPAGFELLSTGPASSSAELPAGKDSDQVEYFTDRDPEASNALISDGGRQVAFTTTERLLAADTDDGQDAYLREVGGGLKLLSPTVSRTDTRSDVGLAGFSRDGRRAALLTRESLTCEDPDPGPGVDRYGKPYLPGPVSDIYVSDGDAVRLVTPTLEEDRQTMAFVDINAAGDRLVANGFESDGLIEEVLYRATPPSPCPSADGGSTTTPPSLSRLRVSPGLVRAGPRAKRVTISVRASAAAALELRIDRLGPSPRRVLLRRPMVAAGTTKVVLPRKTVAGLRVARYRVTVRVRGAAVTPTTRVRASLRIRR